MCVVIVVGIVLFCAIAFVCVCVWCLVRGGMVVVCLLCWAFVLVDLLLHLHLRTL